MRRDSTEATPGLDGALVGEYGGRNHHGEFGSENLGNRQMKGFLVRVAFSITTKKIR